MSYQSNIVCGLLDLDLHKQTSANKEGTEASSVVEHSLSPGIDLKKRRG